MRASLGRTIPSFAALAAGLVIACARTPEPSSSDEPSSSSFKPSPPSASNSASSSASPAVASARTAASVDAAARSEADTFCEGAYLADAPILEQKCSAKDYTTSLALERSAARFCAKDLALLLGFGRTRIDAAKGQDCVAAVKAAASSPDGSAQGTFFTIPPCDSVVVGSAGAGQACRFPPECAAGLTCVGYAVGVDGVCKAPGRVGGACSTQRFGGVFDEDALAVHHASCAKGAYCDGKACAARSADGGACVTRKTCMEGHACVMGKCAASRSAAGGACAKAEDCAPSLFCDGAVCAEKKSAGDACTSKEQCKGFCDLSGLDAGRAGVCAASCGSG